MAAVLTSVTPAQGSTRGGTPVTLTGSGFGSAQGVRFGSALGVGLTVVSSTQIQVLTPLGAVGQVTVVVVASDGNSSQNVTFTYVSTLAPVITALSPTGGPVGGGTSVTITGSGFSGASQVRFGSVAASFTVNDATQITAATPAGAGPVLATIITPGGVSNPAPYCYSAASAAVPFITGVAPDQGPLAGGTLVVVNGTGFASATNVRFGAVSASFMVVNDTQLTATAPAGTGTVQVTVTTPGGTSATSGLTSYTYVVVPVVTTLNPAQGPATGGNLVTITGSGFTYVTDVHFAAAPASFSVVSDTQIVAAAPSGAGVVGVTVGSAGGTSSPPRPYTYV